MWSNISAPKSNLKSAQVGQSSPPSAETTLNQQLENGNTNTNTNNNNNNNNNTSNNGSQVVGGAGSSPLMRYKHALCASHSSGFIYLHGGRFGQGLQLDDDVWRFEPHLNSWCQLVTSGASGPDDKPPSLQEHTLVEHAGYLYLFGGQVSAASGQENSFWRLELSSCKWSSLNHMKMRNSMRHGAYLGPTNRRGHSALVYRDSMYIFGGYEDFRGSSSQLWQFDLLNERWELRNLSSTSACHPEPRHAHSAILYQDSMYIYGGLSNLKPLGDLWRWSWRDKRWFKERTRGPSPGALHGHSAIQAFNSMFVFGGERHSGRPTRSLWRLNLDRLSWQKIRPKGPRPHPTTWHAAVANPMNVLDEANYLIESTGSQEDDHQQQEPRQVSSISDNCFFNSNNNNKAMHSVRPLVSDIAQLPPAPKVSASDYQLARKSKRKLRLNFLSRRERQTKAHKVKSIPTSRSLTQLASEQVAEGSSKPEVPMKLELINDRPVRQILDTLHTDIEQMFESHALESAPPMDENVQAKAEVGPPTQLTRDSITQSQLSSFQASYQTAREQLTSQSTLTITAEQVQPGTGTVTGTGTGTGTGIGTGTGNPVANPLAEVRQRRSMHQFNNNQVHRRQNSAHADRKARPKSEIVQSLIDRADARIKHLYTPLFQPAGQTRPLPAAPPPPQLPVAAAFNSNDPILGALQNHRMFERPAASKRASGSLLERRANYSTGRVPEILHRYDEAISKRHTIHQTMTYYSLFFAEAEGAGKPEDEQRLVVQPSSQQTSDSTSSSCTIRKNATPNSYESTTPALVGVRDGSHAGDAAREEETGSVASSTCVQSSRTLRHEQMSECNQDDQDDQDHDHHQDHDGQPNEEAPSELGGDNTSMSFSTIAEFEEDDMLQYSSPTDLNEVRGEEVYENENEHENEHDDDDEDDYDMQLEGQERTGSAGCKHQLVAQKSSSSGYDSLRSSPRALMVRAPVEARGCRTRTIDSIALTSTTHTSTSDSSAAHSIGLQLMASPAKTLHSLSRSPDEHQLAVGSEARPRARRSIAERLFSKKPAKQRYWQLCMFVMGGKQAPISESLGSIHRNEPINIWRLYI